jgi:alpha-N-acetylglucosamine transferase
MGIEGMKILEQVIISTVLYADDQVILIDSDEELQRAFDNLFKISPLYGMEISISETKSIRRYYPEHKHRHHQRFLKCC